MVAVRRPESEAALDGKEAAPRDGARLSRRTTLSGGVMALVAACGLGACSGRPEPRVLASAPPRGRGELDWLADPWREVRLAGEPLNMAALRRFYAQNDFKPVWAGRDALAHRLANLVLRAGDHGLDPEMFRASLLQRRETFPPVRRELLLTDALLSYAGALAHGAVPPGRRKDFEALKAPPTDVTGAIHAAIRRPDPVAAIEALAPRTPTYQALRRAMRGQRPAGRAGGRAAANRLRTIEVNLERERWLPRSLPADRVWVNIPDQQLVLYRDGRPEFSTRVVVGEAAERHQSPEFDALIEASFFNPPWVIPRDIVEAEILPLLERDPDYLARHNMIMRANGEVEQLPGPEAGLGFILFDMPNRFDVYLHDTPDRHIFRRGNRRLSRGCIRVEKPRELAALLMQQPIEEIDRKIAIGSTTRSTLPTPVPVFVTYHTAFAGSDGAMQFRPDFYNRDPDVWRRLRLQPQASA